MKSKLLLSIITTCFVAIFASTGAERVFKNSYPRPSFDKTAYKKTVWSTANPWWPPNLSHRLYFYGGPDYSWDKFSDNKIEMWKQVAERYHKYGLTGLQMETASYVNGAQEVAEGFAASNTGMKVMPFMQVHGKTADDAREFFLKVFAKFGDDLWKHKGFYRLDGRPVVFIYRPTRFNSEEWKQIITAVEKKYGSMIWLFDCALVGKSKDKWASTTRDLLKAFDGISMYGNWGARTQRQLFEVVTPIMHNEYPQKIFEAGVHTNYTNHHWFGGVDPDLTSKYRDSWDIVLKSKPDSISVTNWFDILENSRIMPSHELEDIRLRLLQYFAAGWRDQKQPETEQPLIYVTWPTHALIGQYLNCEIIVFPAKNKNKTLIVQLEFYGGDDKKLRTLKKEIKSLDSLKVFKFSLLTEHYKNYNGVYPRLRYRWDKWHLSQPLPHTNISTSIRPRLLFWARSNRNLLQVSTSKPWRINNITADNTMTFKENPVLFTCSGKSTAVSGKLNTGGDKVRILRNWREFRSIKNLGLDFALPLMIPSPGATLDWYNIELSNSNGARYMSKPIWMHDGSRDKEVELPIYSIEEKIPQIKKITVKDYRIPFFLYNCDFDAGYYILDSSGNEHHGSLDPTFRRGGLYRTSYRYEHTGKISTARTPQAKYLKDYNGKSCLYFDGKGYGAIMGGTAFPYSFTYEMYICPEDVAKKQTFLAAGNGQINLTILPGGKLMTNRGKATEGAGGEKLTKNNSEYTAQVVSKTNIESHKWTHVAVVYDLKNLKLYINGKFEGEVPLYPSRASEWINPMIIGGACRFPYWGIPQFAGGMRKIRFYGRPLESSEFLLDK
jgi:hypothetical protein